MTGFIMTRLRLAALALGALVLAGCAGQADPPAADPEPNATVTATVTADPALTPDETAEPEIEGGVVEPSYPDTLAIVAKINEVTPCKADGKPDSTLYSDRSLYCTYKAPDGVSESMIASTYDNAAQQQEAVDYFLGPNSPQPGVAVVMGNGWTVVTDTDVGMDVAKVLRGTYLPPM